MRDDGAGWSSVVVVVVVVVEEMRLLENEISRVQLFPLFGSPDVFKLGARARAWTVDRRRRET